MLFLCAFWVLNAGGQTTSDDFVGQNYYAHLGWLWGLLIFVLTIVLFFVYRYKIANLRQNRALKLDFDKRLLDIEMGALRAQMNPHFIFNCLNSINRYIVKNDPITASLYLTKFSKLMRLILDNSRNKMVSLENELTALKLYIEMEDMRFDNKFTYAFNISKDMSLNLEIPPMLIQPFVENAIWHGLLHKHDKGILNIDIKRTGNDLVCTIEDNGIGRQKAEALKTKPATQKSYGIKITSDRLELINQTSKIKSTVTIIDLYDFMNQPRGTRVILNIPINES